VNGIQRGRRLFGRRPIAVHDPKHGIHGAPETPERMREEIAVIGDARRYQRMRELEEERPLSAEEQHRLAVDAAEDAVARKEAVVTHRAA
jgi:hypothetical protein